ncbi:Smr/MutS family protein [Arenibacter echinorum]|uniref:Smr domain-containing protein n=1 Tax=Arenibacter echinorum TaxID=440515 RepID=A0A327R0Z8_9FLAO|nr:Smr/MutS family protein [Arenibacter echinorum]RAJ07557.1 Smr domain-containing protein [Arenibacter echinorum]
MDFKVGDQVEAIDDIVQGVVVKINGRQISVESKDGFLLKYTADELLKIAGSNAIKVSNFEVAKIKAEKELPKNRHSRKIRPKERYAPQMEVDLHIDKLTPSTKGMTNFEMLNLQLDTAKRQLDFAIRKKIQKVVFIHGVGEGILKEELHYLFKRYENAKYYDADYQKYGMGATEVYFFQNTP